MSTNDVNGYIKQHVEQLPQESLDAVYKLRDEIETKFIEMGQLFSHIKATKLFRFKGYESFKDYVETEHRIGVKTANKLIRIQVLFVEEMDMDEELLKEIGQDRLLMIAPLVDKAEWGTRDELVKLAADLPIADLKIELKKRKDENKSEQPQDLKQVLVEQFKEKVCNWLNCPWKEAQFKLGLWFSAMPLDGEVLATMKDQIKTIQRNFEEEMRNG